MQIGSESMMRLRLSMLGLCVLFGCGTNSPAIRLPTSPLTAEEKIAIAMEDSETCDCGRVVVLETEAPTGNDFLDK